jgi:hypothetical protein
MVHHDETEGFVITGAPAWDVAFGQPIQSDELRARDY